MRGKASGWCATTRRRRCRCGGQLGPAPAAFSARSGGYDAELAQHAQVVHEDPAGDHEPVDNSINDDTLYRDVLSGRRNSGEVSCVCPAPLEPADYRVALCYLLLSGPPQVWECSKEVCQHLLEPLATRSLARHRVELDEILGDVPVKRCDVALVK